jgi:hypothetical protein
MIHGLFLDPRTWKIDFLSSPFWNTEGFGIKIDLHPNAFNIPKMGIDKKYKFVITTEVWEIPLRKSLEYLKEKGLKIFLMPREPFKSQVHKTGMFYYNKFMYNGEHFFTPDVVFAPGRVYSELWGGRAVTEVTGYPRWDYYLIPNMWQDKISLCKKYGLSDRKKTIFFPSYPPYHYEKKNGKDSFVDLSDVRNDTIKSLVDFVDNNKGEYQLISKIHPMSFKCFRKGTGNGKEVSGLLKHYYKNPTDSVRIVGDIRNSGIEAKEILIMSDIVVGFATTMLLEAVMLNKPSIHILFGCTKDINGLPEYAENMTTAYNYDELHKCLESKVDPGNKDILDMYVSKTEHSVCKRVCEAIKKHL